MKIVLLGSPGAGKDTLANQFKSVYSYTVLCPGEIFRKEAEINSDLGLYAKNEYWGKGLLCPDEITNALVKNTFDKLSDKEKAGVIFNGFPRSLQQVEYLNYLTTINMAIDLSVPEDMAVERLLRRGREDDIDNIIRERFRQYKKETLPISEYYKNMPNCKYIGISSDNKPEVVFNDVYNAVSNYIAKI